MLSGHDFATRAFVLKVMLLLVVSVEAEAQVRVASNLEKEFGGHWIGAVCSTPQPTFLQIRVSHVHSNVATYEEHGISGFDGIQLRGSIGGFGKLHLEIPSGSDVLSIHLRREGLTLVGTSVGKHGDSDEATKVVLVYDQGDTSLEDFKRQVPTVCDLYPEGLDRYAQLHSREPIASEPNSPTHPLQARSHERAAPASGFLSNHPVPNDRSTLAVSGR